MDQQAARSLARMVGEQARGRGFVLTNTQDPSLPELARQCDEGGVDIHELLAAN